MKQLLAVAVLALNAVTAHAGEQDARAAVAADAASTAAALSVPGIAEVNPLAWATVPLRLAVMEHAKTLPREEGQPVVDAMSASSWGAAANNVLVLVGAGAAAPLIGVVVGYAVWKAGSTEREFWRVCAVYKQFGPPVQCAFKPWKADDLTRIAQGSPRAH
jgi:hypothetical protein